jgi:hypothetical protein
METTSVLFEGVTSQKRTTALSLRTSFQALAHWIKYKMFIEHVYFKCHKKCSLL